MYIRIIKTFLLFWAILLCFACAEKNTKLTSLVVEYTETPLGIDTEKPRFSWQMVSPERGQKQTAYQIIVTNEKQEVVWDTGKVSSDESLNIEYHGLPLEASTRYYWTLGVWNQNDSYLSAQSWFETGLMSPTIDAWDGAEWIGGEDDNLVLYPSYLPVFHINYTVQLNQDKGSTKASFIFGANDPRLMNKNLNIYNLQNEPNKSYVEVELDITEMGNGRPAMLNIYRAGYAPEDTPNAPFQSLLIPSSLINNENKYKSHTIILRTMYSSTHFYIDTEDDKNKVGTVVINPLGNSWDYICFPLLCDIGFAAKANQQFVLSDLEIRNYRVPQTALFKEDLNSLPYKGIFSPFIGVESGLSVNNGAYEIDGRTNGCFFTADTRKNSMPMLRTTFSTQKKKIAKARLYITSRGVYEAYLNGERIGNDYFNPGLTQYNKHHLYQTYDITDQIQKGDNAVGVLLGEGWWSGAITYMGNLWNLFGDKQAVLAKLVITYEDGSSDKIVSSPDTWRYYNDGPIVYSSFFQGEVYDAQKESSTNGWHTASFDDSGWKHAAITNQENAIVFDKDIQLSGMPAVNVFSEMKLIGQFGETVRKVRELTAVSVEEVRPGVFVYDMGQNMAGIPKIQLNGQKPGKQIRLRFAEVKYPDLPEFEANKGMIMLENIRGALAQDLYITKGGDEVIHPRFTFHGYRFIEISGIDKALPLQAVKGDVLSSIHALASSYETSNTAVNRLWENITWSTLGNFISIPTDCPQRNERMGWSGDISVFSRTSTYLGNLSQFLRRHLLAMRDTQREDGRFADVAPVGGGFGGILWGSAGITVAWESYLQYNDKAMLTEHYEAMKAYINYLISHIDPATGLLTEGNLGDWLGPEQHKNDNSLLWECYFIYDLDIMQRIAQVLDKTEDADFFNQMHAQRKAFFNQTYLDPQTGKTIHSGFRQPDKKGEVIGTQTSYILPLAFHICDTNMKTLVLQNLKECIKNETKTDQSERFAPYSLMTGFIGTAWINRVLSDNDETESAYRILQQRAYPSWLYSVDQGATTIWERLNSYTKEKGFNGNNSMNSFNHYSFGAIGSWMYNHSLGIERDENSPGFKHFILKPEPDPTGQMTTAKGHYDSMYGRIESSWVIEGDICKYRFAVPANTTATVYLPTADSNSIRMEGKPFKGSQQTEGKHVAFELESGTYHFEAKLP